ncbi:MAG: TRAP transporter small permease [Pseudomonadota bacterium]
MQTLRRMLDALYLAAGWIAAIFLVAILVLIVVQMAARWTGSVVPGTAEYAGYCMAAASFFALAHALNRGAHIRVSLILSRLGPARRMAEILAHGLAALLAIFFARYAIKATWWSHKLNDVSQGQDATPLWIPQLAMAAGTVLLAVALLDQFLRVLLTRHPGVPDGGEGAADEIGARAE